MGDPTHMPFVDGRHLGDVDADQYDELRGLERLRGIDLFPIVTAEEWCEAYPEPETMGGGSCPSSAR